jgi:hypothetical protein
VLVGKDVEPFALSTTQLKSGINIGGEYFHSQVTWHSHRNAADHPSNVCLLLTTVRSRVLLQTSKFAQLAAAQRVSGMLWEQGSVAA